VILRSLRDMHPEFVFPRSATTRPRREGEGDLLYHFVSDTEFTRWIDEGKFLEWAQVHKGARYGTLRDEILPPIDAGRTVVREVDVQGFKSIRRHPEFSESTHRLQTIFILPENEEQLIGRIKSRAPISAEELARRVESMKDELSIAKECDIAIKNVQGKLSDTIRAVEEAIANG
jgi:guanylate kinase